MLSYMHLTDWNFLRGMPCKSELSTSCSRGLTTISLAYRTGVTSGVVAPTAGGMISGLSTHFDTGASHRLAKCAVLQETAAFHVSIGTGKRSISTQIATLRHLLFGGGEGALGRQFDRIVWVSYCRLWIQLGHTHDVLILGRDSSGGGSTQRRHHGLSD